MVTGGVATATVAPVGASKMNYIATITPNAVSEGDVTVRVDADGCGRMMRGITAPPRR